MNRRKLIEELIALTKLQTVALEKEDIDEFNILLDKRQEVLEQIQVLYESGSETKDEKELVAILKALNEKNQIEFMRQHEEVKLKLREIRQMKKREEHYNNSYDISREEGVFFDKKERR